MFCSTTYFFIGNFFRLEDIFTVVRSPLFCLSASVKSDGTWSGLSIFRGLETDVESEVLSDLGNRGTTWRFKTTSRDSESFQVVERVLGGHPSTLGSRGRTGEKVNKFGRVWGFPPGRLVFWKVESYVQWSLSTRNNEFPDSFITNRPSIVCRGSLCPTGSSYSRSSLLFLEWIFLSVNPLRETVP